MGLKQAYDLSREILGPDLTECWEAAEEVERLRLAWQPDRVRTLILAESHVWTTPEEVRSHVKQPDGIETGFARFVYCLGCGEKIVEPPVKPNGGTPQFWKLFHDTVYGPDVPHASLLKSTKTETRIKSKLHLLGKMRSNGTWLIDASVTAHYVTKNKTSRKKMKLVLRACWESHIGEVVRKIAPSAVLIVGKEVDRAIGNLVRRDLPEAEVVVIYQPQARASKSDRDADRQTCFELCRRHQDDLAAT